MTIIVTGGAGFIGGNFIHYHLKEHPEDRVVCVDKLTYAGNLSTLKPVMDNPNFRFCKLDICDRDGIFALFEEELCVGDIAAILNLSQSSVSHQLRILKDNKLVKFRRDGKSIYYALDDDHVRSILKLGMEHVEE